MENVGIALKSWLKANNLTQTQIADSLGVSQVRISKLISGKINFGRDMARRWADTFGFSYTFLLTGEGSLFDNDESLIMQNVSEDLASGADVESFEYWKKKYEESEQEVTRLRGQIEGMQMALNAFGGVGSSAPTLERKSAL